MARDPDWQFDLCGGYLAIDFANTVSARHSDAPIERLPDYRALVAFAQQTGLVERERAEALRGWGQRHGPAARALVAGAVELREALYRLFAAMAHERPPPAADLAVLNRWNARLALGSKLEWEWTDGAEAPDAFLGRVVRSAVELATTAARRERIKICDADDCVWLFLDTSKNGSRRWCDMEQCGNRMKARRFYKRHRDGVEPG